MQTVLWYTPLGKDIVVSLAKWRKSRKRAHPLLKPITPCTTMGFFPLLKSISMFICLFVILREVDCSFCEQTDVLRDCKLLYVNDSDGVDSPTCGTISQPCKSFAFSVKRAFLQGASVCLNISAGSYEEKESVKIDCRTTPLRRLVFFGERYVTTVVP